MWFGKGTEESRSIVPIETREISDESVPTVSAREVHRVLKARRDFSTWIKDRIERYGFEEGRDYVIDSIDHQNGEQ